MYGILEKWLVDIIYPNNDEVVEFTLQDGCKAAIVSREMFDHILDKLNSITSLVFGSRTNYNNYTPHPCDSDIDGLKTIVHAFWNDFLVLDLLTSGNTKTTTTYLTVYNYAFTTAWFIETLRGLVPDVVEEETVEELWTAAVATGVEPKPEQESKSEPEPEPAMVEVTSCKKSLFQIISEMLSSKEPSHTQTILYTSAAGKQVLFHTDNYNGVSKLTDRIVNNLIDICSLKNTNVILHCNSLINLTSKKYRSEFDGCVQDCLVIMCNTSNSDLFASAGDDHGSRMCLGYRVKHMLVPKTNYPELDTAYKLLSPYRHFDKIFKDSFSNVIWAFFDRFFCHCALWITYDHSPAVDEMFTELAYRLVNNPSVETCNARDLVLYENFDVRSMEEYVDFSVTNGSSQLAEMKESYERHRSNYTLHMNKAMEHAKEYTKISEFLASFNELEYGNKQRAIAQESYRDTRKIEKVSGIYIENNVINIYTKNLYAMDDRTGVYHDIGTFHIMIGMLGKYSVDTTVKIRNTKFQITGMSECMQAPHVFSNGYTCHGNIGQSMSDAYMKKDLYSLAMILIIFLQQANTDDTAGKYVNCWPAVTTELALSKDGEDFDISQVEREFNTALSSAIATNY